MISSTDDNLAKVQVIIALVKKLYGPGVLFHFVAMPESESPAELVLFGNGDDAIAALGLASFLHSYTQDRVRTQLATVAEGRVSKHERL